jgi:hypothetical protein
MCSSFFNYSRFNSQHNWRGGETYMNKQTTFTLTINKVFIRAAYIMRTVATRTI